LFSALAAISHNKWKKAVASWHNSFVEKEKGTKEFHRFAQLTPDRHPIFLPLRGSSRSRKRRRRDASSVHSHEAD
jgi:hypothetical protein